MPLRDHFRPPVSTRSSWEGLHGGWPMAMVQQLAPILPLGYTAEPRVHLGAYFEIDVSAYENDDRSQLGVASGADSGAVATAPWAPPQPTFTTDVDLVEQYEYAVHIYDQARSRQLVAAVEIVSPTNKDRPENRQAFVTKCAALLQQGVCVSMVDLVTTRDFNLYIDLLAHLDRSDPAFAPRAPRIYAATCHGRHQRGASQIQTWAYSLAVGQPLPTLPIWLSDTMSIALDLETSYEATCQVLRVPCS